MRVLRYTVILEQKRVIAIVENHGRVVIAEGKEFKTDWTLAEVEKVAKSKIK